MKITFIGGGNMAVALIGGLRKQGFSAAGIQVVEPFEAARERLTDAFGVRCAAAVDAAALNCEVLVLAVKPQQLKEAVAPFRGKLGNQLVISIAAGLRMTDISRWLGNYDKLVRTMPNTPALIGAGITGLCADPTVDLEGRTTAEKILKAVGSTVWIENEEKMDAVTAVSGSGPAYVFYFLEAMEAAALNLGFEPRAARQLTVETFLGAARLAEQSSESISTLRERVTSKGGTTEAALLSFGASGIAGAIEHGIMAAEARGRELGDILGKD
ncbi:MAG: pyrroline-5-carboxylate reductase [Rhodocyclales bacterium RIFCSPLOWO2_02_FULL_63_24]|nr:MAG: pyrroline-5-carboxylate reductase [Rhodocyclales bacterium GWA2_65_19]OHC72702.1 MAG: pyrroline-5-carboxylate reductase [Rhodocyclales bacterium RIFCSPLOWO2_02_FULL_63_24]